ncbi:MAG: FprA family A-type flavoprotein [Victivallaceae bacterium]|nr:FprA family A-type flavoprotein [Victivallaceae bacterium]
MQIELRKNIYWVGYVDWDVRDFHGYRTDRGSSYNAYLIKDEKIAVIDSVKAPFADHLLANVAALTPLDKVDYVVCNHAEPDHSGALPELMKACVNAELVCNEKCRKTLSMYYDTAAWKFRIVDEANRIALGMHTLTFMNTPMAHWPESMFSYVPEEKLLFSMDAFGQHYARSERFDDEVPLAEAMQEAKTYYANIIMLYGKPVGNVLNRAAGLDIAMIAPSHGIIWRKNLNPIIEAYKRWSVCKAEPKVLIFFDSMWHSTEKLAEAIYEGAKQPGVSVVKHDLKTTNITVLADETLDCAVLAVGSPTLNKGMMPKVAEALTYLQGLAPAGKAAVAFGSYGWAPRGGAHAVQDCLRNMGCELVREEPLQCQFAPAAEVLETAWELGGRLAEKALEIAEKKP